MSGHMDIWCGSNLFYEPTLIRDAYLVLWRCFRDIRFKRGHFRASTLKFTTIGEHYRILCANV